MQNSKARPLPRPVVIAMPGNEQLADELATLLWLERGAATVRRFPDGESYVRIASPVGARAALIVCTLDRPDDKLVPLLLLAKALREAGARSVGLVAPYLPYMRQDRCFQPGETISAQHVGAWISQCVDWLVTVDPHLHRIADLSQVYSVPSRVVHAAGSVAQWIRAHVREPLLIGPDEESAQWVGAVAKDAHAPFVVLSKVRRGDRDVEVSVPDLDIAIAHAGAGGRHRLDRAHHDRDGRPSAPGRARRACLRGGPRAVRAGGLRRPAHRRRRRDRQLRHHPPSVQPDPACRGHCRKPAHAAARRRRARRPARATPLICRNTGHACTAQDALHPARRNA